MFGAVAAGKKRGGYDSIYDAAPVMGKLKEGVFKPNPAAQKVYDRLFAEYLLLHDTFGRGGNDVMKRLKAIKAQSRVE
jgi:L-ribulokinase